MQSSNFKNTELQKKVKVGKKNNIPRYIKMKNIDNNILTYDFLVMV